MYFALDNKNFLVYIWFVVVCLTRTTYRDAMNKEEQYSTLDIVRKLGVPRERLRVWVDQGFVIPSIQKAQGQGTKNLFSRNDVYDIALFKHFVDNLRLPREMATELVNKRRSLGTLSGYPTTRQFEESVRRRPSDVDLIVFIKNPDQDWQIREADFQSLFLMFMPEERIGFEWENVITVNFFKIRQEVDTAIG